MKTKTIVVFSQDEFDTIQETQDLMCKYMEKLNRTSDYPSELYKHAENVFHEIDWFLSEYEAIDATKF